MSKDFDDIYKKIDQSHKELHKQDVQISNILNDLHKNNDKILKEISDIKKQTKDISYKIDLILEILNNFTIMLAEDEDELEDNDTYDNYDDNDDPSWLKDDRDFWHNDEENDDG